ncbi:hypothetical protein V6x_54570 [Gimesia chilikensis]|uniref:DUF488 domain-containing protein n=1 Tax=Gimesia chilikensis TaxID=2605989 RepID=A0A517WKC6_9PLAN|nr:DUF488 domain-containing protein [Gimesia chilikensis]QDU05716.1 hypothetical protein V6x_54570 [Gimesia chilikensis]
MSELSILFTIGHSTRTLDQFVSLLKQNEIDAVADVRSSPFSRHMAHFNRDALRESLKAHGILYVFLGDELGARREERECYVEGVAKYELIEKTTAFAEGLERIRRGASKFRIAIMCAEKDPLTCHRTILVARALRDEYELRHIVTENKVLSQEELEQELLALWNMSHPKLFQQPGEILEEAYRKQSDEIAYVVPKDESTTGGQVTAHD